MSSELRTSNVPIPVPTEERVPLGQQTAILNTNLPGGEREHNHRNGDIPIPLATHRHQDNAENLCDPLPMSAPDITEIEREAVSQVLMSSSLSFGPNLDAFEKAVAGYTGVEHAVAVNSGTSGLHLAVKAAGIGEGDLVLTTPFSFVASANCVLYERAIPIFVDVDETTGNIDTSRIEQAARELAEKRSGWKRWLPPSLREGNAERIGRLKAILPVDVFGQPADMDPILATARSHDLTVIEDACEAIGAEYKGKRAGSLSHSSVFAFYPNKVVTTGEGGMIVTNNEEWANLFRSLRNQGRDIFNPWLHHNRLGFNFRLDEMSAALGRAQMQRIDELINKRARVADWYNQRLADVPSVRRPQIVHSTTRMSWFVYVIQIQPPGSQSAVMQRLAESGIPSRVYFTPIHLQPFYRESFGYKAGDFPVTEHLSSVSLALPFSGVMTEAEVDRVCAALRAALGD